MGEIVAAVGTCHTPYMFTRPPDENPQQLDAGRRRDAGARQGPRRDEAGRHSVLGSDHVETFSVTCVPTFAIIAGSRAIAKFAGREYDLPVHREMAEDLLNKLVVDHDFDIAYSEDAELGHAFAVPFEYVIGGAQHSGGSVLHQRLRSAAADAAPLRGARAGDRARSSRAARSASRSSPAAACRTSPARRKYLTARVRFRPLAASRSSRPATPMRCWT